MGKNVKILGQLPLGEAELFRQMLLDEGVDANVVSGDPLGMGATLWVPEEQVPLAEVVLKGSDQGGERVPCPACGESNPGSFGECWSCGASLDGDGSDRKRWPEAPEAPVPPEQSGPRWLAFIIVVVLLATALMWISRHLL